MNDNRRVTLQLPSIPRAAMRLLGILSDPEVPTGEIVKLAQADPAVTAKILKAANSPVYGGSKSVDSLDHAVVRMGRDNIACLVTNGNRRVTLQLPSIPRVAIRLLAILSDPEVPTGEIVKLIQADPAITAKILTAANSPLFGAGRCVDSLDRAVVRMGRNNISYLALSFSLSQTAREGGALNRYFKKYWLQSVIHALAMECLAKRVDPGYSGAAFVAGLLMDIGVLTLLRNHASSYTALLDESRTGSRRLVELEQDRLGTTHTEIAAALLTHWLLPEAMVSVARYHELSPAEVIRGREREHFAQIAAATVGVATADFLCGANPMESFQRLEFLTSKVFGFSGRQLQEYLDGVNERLHAMSELLSADVSDLPSAVQLLACAMEQLSAASLQSFAPAGAGAVSPIFAADAIRELQVKLHALEQASCLDALTGLYHRAYLDVRLSQRLRHSDTVPVVLGILLGDLDRFARVNDTCGHEMGDAVLKAAAQVLQSCVRSRDVVVRYGGEKFAILAETAEFECLKRMAERVRQTLADTTIRLDKHDIKLTISLGGVFVSGLLPRRDDTYPAHLVALAEESLCECKRRGGDATAIRVWAPSDEETEQPAPLTGRLP
jgi:diguanylate cyclase (GGDEF)-like protein